MNTDLLLQLDILWPAFIAGLLVVATHIPMGQEVLRRGIVFLDLAIAQVAALGVVILNVFEKEFLHHAYHGHGAELLQTLVPCIASIIAALGLYRLHKLDTTIQEALIGATFILAATGSMLLVAKDPHGGELLQKTLAGQILWVQPSELLSVGVIFSFILGVWCWGQRQWRTALFYPLFAVTITISTQLVGVYLVFATLIVPALTTKALNGHTERVRLLIGYLSGALAYAIGLCVSALWDLPSGPTIVWSICSVCLTFWLVSRWVVPRPVHAQQIS
jgi:zinc/manganese transport system permease protein